MNARQRATLLEDLQALDDSIVHWENNVELHTRGEKYVTTTSSCALCELQLKRDGRPGGGWPSCNHCIVKVFTEQGECKGTPCEAMPMLPVAELMFLKGVRATILEWLDE